MECEVKVANYESDNNDILTGVTERHLVPIKFLKDGQGDTRKSNILIHQHVQQPLNLLRSSAQNEGFDLRISSGFRSFQRQRLIWNEKLSGLRPVFDDKGKQVVLDQLSDWQKLQAVLRWSALPGSSRHHWGTDFDVYDASNLPQDYQIKLIPEECEGNGIFADFHHWLSDFFSQHPNGFFRPYDFDTGGVSPEKWHISYGPIANIYSRQLTKDVIREALVLDGDVKYISVILEFFDEIIDRFVLT